MACKVGAILYFIVQLVAFVFILVGTPIDMFRFKVEKEYDSVLCLTAWGVKEQCSDKSYLIGVKDLFALCDDRLNRFRVAEAFAIISIAVYGVATVSGCIRLYCCNCLRWFCLVLNIVGIATACIVWAIMVEAYYGERGMGIDYCGALKQSYKYGAGFALFVTGWCLNIVAIVFLMMSC